MQKWLPCLCLQKFDELFYREHLPISDIQHRTSLSRNTIKKRLKEAIGTESKYQRAMAICKLTSFESALLLTLDADSRYPMRDRRIALMLNDAIQKEGYSGIEDWVGMKNFRRRKRKLVLVQTWANE